mgnify:FL=1
MKKIFSTLALSLSFLIINSGGLISQELNSNEVLESKIEEQKKNNLILSTNSSNDKNVEISLTGIGYNPEIKEQITNDLITLEIKTSNLENIDSFQSLSIPSVGIKTLIVSGY